MRFVTRGHKLDNWNAMWSGSWKILIVRIVDYDCELRDEVLAIARVNPQFVRNEKIPDTKSSRVGNSSYGPGVKRRCD